MIKEHHEVGGQGSWPRGSGAKTSKKGVARGMAKLHRKIRLLECARGGVFGGGTGGGGNPGFGGFPGMPGFGGSWPSTRSGQ